jgi:hypothetical protein
MEEKTIIINKFKCQFKKPIKEKIKDVVIDAQV